MQIHKSSQKGQIWFRISSGTVIIPEPYPAWPKRSGYDRRSTSVEKYSQILFYKKRRHYGFYSQNVQTPVMFQILYMFTVYILNVEP
jgi:hypothetical protein